MFSKEAVVDHGAEDIEGGDDYIQQRVCVFVSSAMKTILPSWLIEFLSPGISDVVPTKPFHTWCVAFLTWTSVAHAWRLFAQ